ncbi:MAG: N-acetylmuramoyl-L-alanine amidase [Algoriphagus sp.]|nr:N-acetylmuramoyl-L-alanine amidase [Algoriphagus sp.]
MERFNTKKNLLRFLILVPFLFGGFIPNETMMPAFRMRKIVLDAGHGGSDPGNIGSKAREKDINLAVTLLVGKYIKENMPDVEVIYTRSDDSFPTLKQRPNIANVNKADLFVSIHSENYKEEYEGFDPTSPESYMMFNLMQKAYVGNSITLADRIETQFRDNVGRKSRGVKQGPFYVLWTPSMPSVLVELGFLSNTEEERFLMTKEGQEYMASAIYRSIKEYKSEIEIN